MQQMNMSWIEPLKAKGFSGLSGLMAAFAFIASTAIILMICAFLSIGFFMLRTESADKSWGNDKNGAHLHTAVHTTRFKLSPDPACMAEVRKNGANDVSKCPLISTPLTSKEAPTVERPDTLVGKIYTLLPTLINIIPAVVLAYGLLQAGFCFVQLSHGRYFASRTIMYLRNFAFAGLFYVMISPCLPLIYTLVANLISAIDLHIFTSRPVHYFTLPGPYTPPSFAIGSAKNFISFLTAIYAFTLAIIAALMTKASAIAEDNAQII